MQYDLEILVPAETDSEKIVRRLQDFKKYGLINVGDTKIRLVFATSKGNDPSCLQSGWPDGVSVEILETPYKHVAQRIYHYYASFAEPDTAKWYLRVDEDSMTDIGGLVKNLEQWFDHERDYHISGDFNYDVEQIDYNILRSLGFDWWYEEDSPSHEHESSITSNAAMSKILSDPTARQYFKLRQEFAEGHGDHGLCFAARMCKVYHTQVKFITREPYLTDFSQFGGRYNHIHWTARDKNPEVLTWLESLDEEADLMSYIHKSYLLSRHGSEKHWIRLAARKFIEQVSGNKEKFGLWGVTKTGQLTIFVAGNLQQNREPIVFQDGDKELVCRDYVLAKL